jgi:hypothetical protein
MSNEKIEILKSSDGLKAMNSKERSRKRNSSSKNIRRTEIANSKLRDSIFRLYVISSICLTVTALLFVIDFSTYDWRGSPTILHNKVVFIIYIVSCLVGLISYFGASVYALWYGGRLLSNKIKPEYIQKT